MKKELGDFRWVENFNGKHGPVRNQFIIYTDKATIFQSYRTIIAAKMEGKTILDIDDWDCSVTTGKYRNMFLGESKQETERKIRAGIYELASLN